MKNIEPTPEFDNQLYIRTEEDNDWDPETELDELWDLAPEECFMDEEDGLPDSYFE